MKNKHKEMTVRELASIGGKSRARKLSSARLSQIGRKAVKTRWARHYAKLEASNNKKQERNKHDRKRSKTTKPAA